ncbi:hypothetical protein [Frigoriglobus tundricola]|uniref:Uncharacterized protein n=1 Tax=Frigoriglobus tundricola TaxID=2774151 RepID=A0A6M5YL61_9BACT|nr:hypothetical protein [Frigoriglobus tundricola]QJW94026.1 hypothetical protein FTUN_1545 [Frigoriglobus tundricola]
MSEVPVLDPAQRDAVRSAVLAAAVTPQKRADLVKAAKAVVTAKKDKEKKAVAEGVIDEMIQAGELHKQSAAATAPIGITKPPLKNDPEKVRAALLASAETPQTLAKLITAAVAATKADKAFVTDEANKLISSEQLHKHSTAAKPPYGAKKKEAPHALDIAPGKAAFAGLLKAAKKVTNVAPGVSLDEVIQRLRAALANEVARPVPVVAAPPPVAPPLAHPEPAPVAAPITPEQIRSGLRAAYDELCLFPEFEDKLVEIRRLYHTAARLLPGLTVPQFHHELEHLQGLRQLELHSLNEVQQAKEPELAIRHNDRLLYYVMWGK